MPGEAYTLDPTPPEPMSGLAGGSNRATGWIGTVHDLTAADKARNFRASLDRQRAAAHPQAAAVGSAIINQTLQGVFRMEAGDKRDSHEIKPMPAIKAPDRRGEWEQRLMALEAEVEALRHFNSEAQSPFKPVFLAAPNPDDPGKDQQWQEQTASGSNITKFQDGRSCLSDDAPGQILDPGTNGAFALLEVRDGDRHAYFKLGGGGAIDILQATTNVATLAPFLNMATNRNTFNILEFFSDTIGGRVGASMRFKDGVNNYAGIYFNAGNWTIDWVRAHS